MKLQIAIPDDLWPGVHEWATWMTVDPSGSVWVHEKEPSFEMGIWACPEQDPKKEAHLFSIDTCGDYGSFKWKRPEQTNDL